MAKQAQNVTPQSATTLKKFKKKERKKEKEKLDPPDGRYILLVQSRIHVHTRTHTLPHKPHGTVDVGGVLLESLLAQRSPSPGVGFRGGSVASPPVRASSSARSPRKTK